MMCLGWSTKPVCAAQPPAQITPGATGGCPDITWFYAAAAGILLLGVMGGGGK
jgi:hypothetical protein